MNPAKGQSGLGRWLKGLDVYADRRMVAILLLGFSSGLPLALTFGTLTVWLAEVGVNKTTIGLFALTGAPYTFKFLWAPVMDAVPLPFLTRRLGRRRGWIVLTQLALMASIALLGATKPSDHPGVTACIVLIVAFCSASQDIVIDAYRVEILHERQYGAGAALIVLGYRIGMLVSGAGALFIATYVGWFLTYAIMAVFVLVGIVTILLNPEPVGPGARKELGRLSMWFRETVVGPLAEFVDRPGWLIVLLFVLLYKFGDALAGVMGNPFYVELGFTKIEIASVSKLFGLGATIVGGIAGGVMVNRMGIFRSLVVCGFLQMASNLMFAVLALRGNELAFLATTIALENLSAGMGTAAFVAYLSSLCNVAYTATQYALLSSLMAFGRTLLSSSGGWLVDHLSWVSFFIVTTAAAAPGLLLLLWLGRKTTVRPSRT